MPTYSMSQLLDKTLIVKNDTAVYNPGDFRYQSDKNIKPVMTLKKGAGFVVYSWISPSMNNDRYYFTTYSLMNGKYLAIPIVDGNFDIKSLQDQGALTVKEQKEAEEKANDTSLLGALGLRDLFKNIKPILIILLVIVTIIYLTPVIMKVTSKEK